jgi:hypothetical protein
MKKLLVHLMLILSLLSMLIQGCSPYELSDPTSARVTMIETEETQGNKQATQEKGD